MDENENNIPVVPDDWAYPKPYKMTVSFADETSIDGYAQKSSLSDEVWVYPSDPKVGYMELIQIFTDPNRTVVIQSNMSETEQHIYEGYTTLASVNLGMDGKYNVCMRKPV